MYAAINPHSLRTGIIKDLDSRLYESPLQKFHNSKFVLKVKPWDARCSYGSSFKQPHTSKGVGKMKPQNFSNLSKRCKNKRYTK